MGAVPHMWWTSPTPAGVPLSALFADTKTSVYIAQHDSVDSGDGMAVKGVRMGIAANKLLVIFYLMLRIFLKSVSVETRPSPLQYAKPKAHSGLEMLKIKSQVDRRTNRIEATVALLLMSGFM